MTNTKIPTKAIILYALSLAVPPLLAQAQTFEPPPAKVTNKFYTSTPAYIVECDDNTRHSLTKAAWDKIRIGDLCPN